MSRLPTRSHPTPPGDSDAASAQWSKPPDRRLILLSGLVLLACLGSVYAWSYFTLPLTEAYGWSKMQVSAVFSLAVAGLGLSAMYVGPRVSRIGPRKLMFRSSAFFITGYLVAALGLFLGSGVIGEPTNPVVSWISLIVLGLGYGVIGGIGLGTGYVTGVTTIAAWFPDRKGFATGLVLMGFGVGALVMSMVFAPLAMRSAGGDIPLAFLAIAVAFLLIMPLTCRGIHDPSFTAPPGSAATVAETARHAVHVPARLILMCFLYSLAGLGVISLLSPLMQRVAALDNPQLGAAELAAMGATLIAVASVGNSLGRVFWGWSSDKIGRVNAFICLLGSSAVAFLILPHVTSPLLFGALLAYAVACYGGGFGTIPSLISDLYGPKRMSGVHGKVLVGWASAGLIAPLLFGYMKDAFPNHAADYAFYLCATVLMLACGLAVSFKQVHRRTTAIVPVLDPAEPEPL